jgi:hypothetical protein
MRVYEKFSSQTERPFFKRNNSIEMILERSHPKQKTVMIAIDQQRSSVVSFIRENLEI